MESLTTQKALFLDVEKRSRAAVAGQLIMGTLLASGFSWSFLSSDQPMIICFVMILVGAAIRLTVSANLKRLRTSGCGPSDYCEGVFGVGALMTAAGFSLLAISTYLKFGFLSNHTLLALVCLCASGSAAAITLSGSRWISQTYLAFTLLAPAIVFFTHETSGRTLGLLTFLLYSYLAHYSETNRKHLLDVLQHGEELKFERERLRHFVDSIPKAIALLDADLRYVSVNSRLLTILGTAEAEIIGKSILKTDPFFGDVHVFLRDSASQYVDKKVMIRTEEGERWHLMKLRKLEHSNEILCFAVDVHNETVLEEAQREAHTRMAQSAKMASLGEMAGGISHEINNPLAIIVGKTDLMLDRLARGPISPETLTKDLAKLKDTAFRISKIIRGLRAFSRSGENDPFNRSMVAPLIEDSLELCRERFRHAGVDLRVDLSGDAAIDCRPSQVSQVVLNLLNNAFDAIQSSESAWIEIKTQITEHRALIVITDSGNGIPPAIAAKLMEPFFTTKPVNKGTGLGLSISKGLVEDHGGTLTYDSSCQNTRFVVEFPLSAESAELVA
jgi:PAS domain S-box-containing protein